MLLAPLAFPAVPDLGRGLLIWDCSKKARLSSETLRYLVRVDTKEARADSYGEHARAFYVEQMQMVNLWRQVSPTSRLAKVLSRTEQSLLLAPHWIFPLPR
jgi:hypothetical protein